MLSGNRTYNIAKLFLFPWLITYRNPEWFRDEGHSRVERLNFELRRYCTAVVNTTVPTTQLLGAKHETCEQWTVSSVSNSFNSVKQRTDVKPYHQSWHFESWRILHVLNSSSRSDLSVLCGRCFTAHKWPKLEFT